MKRTIGIAACLLASFASTALAQQPAPDQGAGNSTATILLVTWVGFMVFIVYFLTRSRRGYKGPIDRSLVLAEEGVQLSRQLLAAQEETNRLLARLVEQRAGG